MRTVLVLENRCLEHTGYVLQHGRRPGSRGSTRPKVASTKLVLEEYHHPTVAN